MSHSSLRSRLPWLALACLAISVSSVGCVTEKKMTTYVDQQVGAVDERVDGVETQVEENQNRISEQQQRIDEQQEQLAQASETARQALDRAVAAGELAEGKLLYETTLSDADVRFGLESSSLSDSAKAALDEFAEDLKARNEAVYIEIQGHTDSTGPDQYNIRLGQERADAVRHYLNRRHGLPLHRMTSISYGEATPITDNGTRDGRGQNRRVVLVVLK